VFSPRSPVEWCDGFGVAEIDGLSTKPPLLGSRLALDKFDLIDGLLAPFFPTLDEPDSDDARYHEHEYDGCQAEQSHAGIDRA
jgi:hypothetical protein